VSLASIIIPVYNGEEYIHRAIECALSQTYPHKEVIVIDDASTDRTQEVVKKYPVIYHRNERNMERHIPATREWNFLRESSYSF